MVDGIDLDKFEWFDYQKEKEKYKSKKEFVSVSTKHSANRIYLNSAVVKNYLKNDTQFLKIGFYDNRYLVISEAQKGEELAFKTKSQGKKDHSSKIITSSPLVSKIVEISGQKMNTIKRYGVKFVEEYNAIAVDLKDKNPE